MTHRLASWWIVLLGGALLSMLWPPLADAQKVSLPPSMVVSKQDTVWWAGQLRMARKLGGFALAGLEATAVDESVPIGEGVLQATRDTYVLIRSARHGMELAKGHRKFPDPLVDLNFARVTDAWNLSRTPVDKISWSLPRREYLDISTRDLREALRLLDRVLVTLP